MSFTPQQDLTNSTDPEINELWSGIPLGAISEFQDLGGSQVSSEYCMNRVPSPLNIEQSKSPSREINQESDEGYMQFLELCDEYMQFLTYPPTSPQTTSPPPQCTQPDETEPEEHCSTQLVLSSHTVNKGRAVPPTPFLPPAAIHQVPIPRNDKVGISKSQDFDCGMNGCRSKFKTRSDLRRHQKALHAQRIHSLSPAAISLALPQRHSCPETDCNRKGERSFTRKDNLIAHMRNVHGLQIPKRIRVKKGKAVTAQNIL